MPPDQTTRKKFLALEQLAEVSVIGFSTNVWPRTLSDGARFYLLPRLGIPVLQHVLFLAGGFLVALWCVIRRDVRILIAQSPYEGLATVLVKGCAWYLFRRRVVVIIESHGDFEDSLFRQRGMPVAWMWRRLMRPVARCALKHADAMRAVSSSTGRQLRALTWKTPLVEFHTWTDLHAFRGNGNEGSRGNIVLFAGVITPLKGIDCLIRAVAAIVRDVPDIQVWIVGSIESRRYARELANLVGQLDLSGVVQFSGRGVSQVELAGVMSQARVLVLPSRSEGLPRVIIEAMTSGLPVIASTVGGIPGLISDGKTGLLVPPDDPGALAQRLLWVLREPAAALRIGQRARVFAREVFSTESYLSGYRRLLDIAEAKLREVSPGTR